MILLVVELENSQNDFGSFMTDFDKVNGVIERRLSLRII